MGNEPGNIEIFVNGEKRSVSPGSSLLDLLRSLHWTSEQVAIERNQVVVARQDFGHTPLQTGDRIEIVTFVGGG